MATSLLILLDDITLILDDVAAMSKVAAQKTAGVLGDDLALNANQVAGVDPDRELPVVWAVAKVLVPSALLISAVAHWAILPLLMLGGLYLCFEGFEKLAHKYLHSRAEDEKQHAEELAAMADPNVDMVQFEKDKIKGAIRTDFILSAEIVVITLGTVATATLMQQVIVVSGIAFIMTVGVYGAVAGIVKLDDVGLFLSQRGLTPISRAFGRILLRGAPYLMKTLSVVGTAAMFLVGGSIISHGFPWLHHQTEALIATIGGTGFVPTVVSVAIDGIVGLLAGALALLLFNGAQRIFKKSS
jgi:uncharacterized protein